jgi:sulfur-carrier protein
MCRLTGRRQATDVTSAAMARLRLFAGLKDAAGTGSTSVDGATVDEVIENAVQRFGDAFGAGVERARIWVNGEEAEPDRSVGIDDEVALLPPVSGGSQAVITRQVSIAGAVGASAVVAFALADVFGSEAWVAAVTVGVVATWAMDLATTMGFRGRDLPVVPVLFAMALAVVSVRMLGSAGLAVAFAVGIVAPMVWGVVSETSRLIHIVAPTILVAVLASLAVSSLLLVEFGTGTRYAEQATSVFLLVAAVATVAGILFERMRNLPFGDPFTVIALAAVAASVGGAAVWDLPLDTFLLMGVVLALGLVGGRAFGMVVRTGRTSLVEQPPGVAWVLDGAILAAAIYQPVLAILT